MKKGEIKMNVYGVNVDIKNVPELDPTFVPLHVFNREFRYTTRLSTARLRWRTRTTITLTVW